MNIIKIDKNNQVNGDGLRCVIWVSGCDHKCPGCHNPETWDHNIGTPLNQDHFEKIFAQLNKKEISGITITGGDPFSYQNREDVAALCARIKQKYPHKTIWVYTGFLYEELPQGLLENIDVLIDGPYIAAKNPGIGKLLWRGSLNQRIIDLARIRESIAAIK